MAHVMFDLETFGTSPGSALRSVGAVVFSPSSPEIGATFYRNIDAASCAAVGLTTDPRTVAWWAQQEQKAQEALLSDPRPLKEVVVEFHAWFLKLRGEFIWCQGAGFDAPLWDAAAKAVGLVPPWKFWNVRDTRTAYDLFGFDPHTLPRAGTYHNAQDDALYQAQCVAAAVAKATPEFLR